MEKTLKRLKVPSTDSIEELSKFWDSHDLTDFQSQLEEIEKPVFVHEKNTSLSIDLAPEEARRLKRIARSKGLKEATILRQWVIERLGAPSSAGRH